MNTFAEYLTCQYQYSQRSIQEKVAHVIAIKKRCGCCSLEAITRAELMKVIHVHKQYYRAQTVNNHLHSLELYFYFLIDTGKRLNHPLKNFRILTPKKPLLRGFLSREELDRIYEQYPNMGHLNGQFEVYAKRNKVILGLIVYQALGSGALERLRLDDVELEKGLIHIPAVSNYKLMPRTLAFESKQIMGMHHYLSEVRPQLLELIRLKKTQLSSQYDPNSLFPKGIHTRFSSITKSIVSKLKKTHNMESLHQLRVSRIALWLKVYNLREVQYRAGYKSLQSLAQFEQDKLELLIEAVNKYHPF